MSKKENLIEKKSAVFSQDVYDYVSSDTYTLDDFEEALEPYWKQFQEPGLRLKFHRSFWPKFEALVKEHEITCKNPDCRISGFKDDLELYLEQEIKKLSLVSGEGFNPIQEENDRFLFLRTAYLWAIQQNEGSPYSVVISTNNVANILGFNLQKADKILTDLGKAGLVQNFLGGDEFCVKALGFDYLLKEEKMRANEIQDSQEGKNSSTALSEVSSTLPSLDSGTRIKLFIIYSHQDSRFKSELEKHMRPLVRGNYVDLFTDTQIEPGKDWNKEIRSNLSQAHIILILVSSDLFASDYSEEIEIKEAFERKAEGDTTLEILPVLIRDCDWKLHTEISKLNLLPYNGVPLANWLNQDEAYTKIIEGVKLTITRLNGQVFPI